MSAIADCGHGPEVDEVTSGTVCAACLRDINEQAEADAAAEKARHGRRCGCDECASDRGDRAYDEWKDEQITRGAQ